ncbi:MAG: ABC transporter substrate-binding protein [Desulfobacterales bacterium]|nr:ABC transporter substrate-binding protein [Desulfobacterales bacterium]
MKHILIRAIIFFLIVIFPFSIFGEQYKWKFKVKPITNNGKKWKIGYYEGGPFLAYPKHLINIVKNLSELGWMEKIEIPKPDNTSESTAIWNFLSQNVNSPYLEFVADAHWNADWDSEKRKICKENALKRLKAKDIDLMLALGTWAGQDLVNDLHSVPTMGISISDSVKSKIIKSPEDSGFEHVHVRCDPDRDLRMITLFYNIFNFKKLGVVYEDTLEGRSYAAMDDIEKVAKERGFEIISEKIPAHNIDENTNLQLIINAHNKLAPMVDAFFITIHRTAIPKNMPQLIAPFLKHKVPTFSQYGTVMVQYGSLISINETADFVDVGRFNANVIASILNGIKPREINQIFENPKKVAINLEVARIIGFDVPPGLKAIADEIYTEIKK